MSDARRYTPRGRTVAERGGRGDPFRPALEVLQGGQSDTGRRAAGRAASTPPAARTAPTRAPQERSAQSAATPQRTAQGAPRIVNGRPVGAARTAGTPKKTAGRKATVHKGPVRKPPRRLSRVGVPRLPSPPRSPKLAEPRRRLRLATVLALVLFGAIGVRLVQLQLTDASAYAAQGLQDRLVHEDLPAPRGAILDRDGNILVHSVEARYVFADPMSVQDPQGDADKLFSVLSKYGVLRSDLVRRLEPHKSTDGKRDVRFEYLARQIDIADGDRIDALKLQGIKVVRDERREVPGYDLASNVIGYTGRGDDLTGKLGIEQGYDNQLRGVDGKHTYEVGEGNLAREIPEGYDELIPARPGSSVELTLDADLQYAVQSTLYQRMLPLGADFATAIVIKVHTGEVVAMASYPSFSAADPGKSLPDVLKDQCTATVFDPGSIHKAIIMGAALQEGVITPNTAISVDSTITKGDTTYTDHPPQKNGTLMTIPGILALSSNVGTIKVADMLGKDRVYEYQQKFGLGQKTNLGLPNEAPGQLLPPDQWSGSSPGSIPIGNGVATTAIQMAAVYNTIANDGTWIQPHLVKQIIAPDGKVTVAPPPVTRKVLDPAYAQQLRTMLEGVTTLGDATGRQAAIPGYRIAGKTGTSKLPQNGGYAPGDVVSFIGMAPADNPQYLVAVTAHVPSGAGGSVAAPAFKEMMADTLSNFSVLPTGTEPPKLTVYP